jgi:C1A family cysteine protease
VSTAHSYGWKPQLPDYRDIPLRLFEVAPTLPSSVDLEPEMPPVYDQDGIGSCTANAAATMFRFVDRKQGLADEDPARLFIYYVTRVLEGSQNWDAGSSIRDAMKVLADTGAPPEADWPYIPSKFTVQPPQSAYDDAKGHESTLYLSVSQTENDMKACLAAGYPFEIGFTVYQNFETDPNGIIGMPSGPLLGGHAVCVSGYDDTTRRWKARNSWGAWGIDGSGNFTIPYDYWTNSNLASDLQTIRQVTGPIVPPAPVPRITLAFAKGFKRINIYGSWVAGASFTLDGVPLGGIEVSPGGFFAARQKGLQPGPHTIMCFNPDDTASLPYTLKV